MALADCCQKIIIDSDAGTDDAVSIYLAMKTPNVTVKALLSVHGNVEEAQAKDNLLLLSQMFSGGTVPVYSGSAHPLIGQHQSCPWMGHGPNGLGGAEFDIEAPSSERPPLQDGHAVNALIRLLREQPGEIDVISLGPLTNLAIALTIEPQLLSWARSWWLMGGSCAARGNTTPLAEFNFHQDPEAARMVFDAFHQLRHVNRAHVPPLHVVPWELAENAALEWARFDVLAEHAPFFKKIFAAQEALERALVPSSSSIPFAQTAAAAAKAAVDPQAAAAAEEAAAATAATLYDARSAADAHLTPVHAGTPVRWNPCDAFAMAALLAARSPHGYGLQVSCTDVHAVVETDGVLGRGALAVDWYNVRHWRANVRLLRTLNADAFFQLLLETVARDRPREVSTDMIRIM